MITNQYLFDRERETYIGAMTEMMQDMPIEQVRCVHAIMEQIADLCREEVH